MDRLGVSVPVYRNLPVIEELFREFLVCKQGNASIYCLPYAAFIDARNRGLICRWSRNRPEDPTRVDEIVKCINRTGCIDGIISLACFPSGEGEENAPKHESGYTLCCYDGNHRRVAAEKTIGFCNILISVLWQATVEEVIERFSRLNSAVSVPLLYIEPKNDVNAEKLLAISEFVTYLVKTYPSHSSPFRGCHPPNFNRDTLVDNLTCLVSELQSLVTPSELMEYLKYANQQYALGWRFDKYVAKTAARAKCEETGLWLFHSSRTLEKMYIKSVIVEHKAQTSSKR